MEVWACPKCDIVTQHNDAPCTGYAGEHEPTECVRMIPAPTAEQEEQIGGNLMSLYMAWGLPRLQLTNSRDVPQAGEFISAIVGSFQSIVPLFGTNPETTDSPEEEA